MNTAVPIKEVGTCFTQQVGGTPVRMKRVGAECVWTMSSESWERCHEKMNTAVPIEEVGTCFAQQIGGTPLRVKIVQTECVWATEMGLGRMDVGEGWRQRQVRGRRQIHAV